MHYTAMAGTVYYIPNIDAVPPQPALSSAALISIITVIVVLACTSLLYIGIRAGVAPFGSKSEQDKNRRLILNVIFFDKQGRILVSADGMTPSKEVLDNNQLGVSCYCFPRPRA